MGAAQGGAEAFLILNLGAGSRTQNNLRQNNQCCWQFSFGQFDSCLSTVRCPVSFFTGFLLLLGWNYVLVAVSGRFACKRLQIVSWDILGK